MFAGKSCWKRMMLGQSQVVAMTSPKPNLIQNNLKKDISTQKVISKKRKLDETQICKENNFVESAAPVVKKVKINNG